MEPCSGFYRSVLGKIVSNISPYLVEGEDIFVAAEKESLCGMPKRYSKEVVYNTFPWTNPTDAQKIKIEQTAQVILEARAQYSDDSLADMYGEKMYLFPELLKAHQNHDRAEG